MSDKPQNSAQPPTDAAALRQRAEAQVRAMESPTLSAQTPEEIQQMLHELRVHQIELEMQNEELRTAQERIEAGRARYFDLYDLAPVGYCTVSDKGLILEANLSAATLLSTTRSALVKLPASRFILKEDQNIYYLHQKKLLATGEAQEYELRLVKPDGALVWAHLTATTAQADDSAPVCRLVISDITARKLAEAKVQEVNATLSSLVAVLQRRDSEFTVLAHMNDLLQTCETQEEAYRIIEMKAAELFAGRSGCLAVSHPSGRYLETVARWGDEMIVEDVFPMVDCWALRRGKPHEVVDPQGSLLCTHFVRPPSSGYRCLPLTVQGETLGIFYLDAAGKSGEDHQNSQRQLALAASEAIKLSLANLRLRKTLHEQATRDPLTGLFNRRYFEETLPRELHRTLRREGSLCIAMLDLDQFKQFNDNFGHEAGDLVLREAGRLLRDGLRKSDIPCRYGGEEFALVLPDSSLGDGVNRLEQTRRRFEDLQIRHNGQLLATVTFSAGVAAVPVHGSSSEDLLRGADAALYAAKHAGRNCVVAFGGGAAPDPALAANA